MSYLAITVLGRTFSGAVAARILAVVVVVIIAGLYVMTRRR